ncbi:MAG: hypothetical protein AB8B60_17345 [Sulfitobacter sp.]
MAPSDPTADALHFLELTLTEAQATVRSYDTKAQIVGIGYTFALNIVAQVSSGFPDTADGLISVLIFWTIVMAPLFLFGAVLYPSRKIAPKISGTSDAHPRHLLYVETSRFADVGALKSASLHADWHDELSFEVLKTSRLREIKRSRFIRALAATALSFAVLCGRELTTLL